jgi:hypothetical protein
VGDGWYTLTTSTCGREGWSAHQFRSARDGATHDAIQEVMFHRGHDLLRIVRAMHDATRWDWISQGEPLAEERPEEYQKRRIRDRFTRRGLLDLAARLGYPFENPDFWIPTAPPVFIQGKPPPAR